MAKNSRKKKKAAQRANTSKAASNSNNNANQSPSKGTSIETETTPVGGQSAADEKVETEPKEYYLFYIPIILILGYVPILMRTLEFSTHLEDYEWFSPTLTTQVDVFLKIKAIFFIIITAVMLLIMLILFFNGNRKYFKRLKSLPFYLIAAAILFVVLSGIFAENKWLLLAGSFENFESIFVTLGYFVAFVYAFVIFTKSDNVYRDFRFVYRASLPGFLIVAVIGFFQTLKLDLFKTDFGQFLFASSKYRGSGGTISVGSGEYATLHNVDYVSTFFAMWAVVFLILFTMSGDIKEKIVRAALFLLAGYDMWAAGSDGGRLGFIAGIVLLVIMVAAGDKKRLIITIAAIIALFAVVLIVPQTRSYILKGINATDADATAKYNIHHIMPEEDGVYFDLDGKEYSVSYSYESKKLNAPLSVTLKDADGNVIEGTYYEREGTEPAHYTYPADAITKDTEISECRYRPEDSDKSIRGIQITADKDKVSLMISNEVDDTGEYYFLNAYGRFVQEDGTQIAEANVFPSKLFSGRGSIWNKTLPILKNFLFIGCGSGLFITAYPQNDYLARMFGSTNYDVKPHNLYLQYWVEEGLPFLLIMLVFFVLYYVMVIRSFTKRMGASAEPMTRRISLACMAAVTVFLVSGIAGDSMIVHAPTFWTFLGIGLAAGWSRKGEM